MVSPNDWPKAPVPFDVPVRINSYLASGLRKDARITNVIVVTGPDEIPPRPKCRDDDHHGSYQSVFQRRGRRFASGKRVKSRIWSPVPMLSERKRL
jgi:hypothetical protein